MAKRDFDAAAGVHRTVQAIRLEGDRRDAVVEEIAEEVPVALVYNGVPHVVVMATPADLEDFALGFSLSEGIIAGAAELGGLEIVPEQSGYSVYLSVPKQRVADIEARRRNMTARTGCGLCGAQTIEQAMRDVPKIRSAVRSIDRAAIVAAMKRLPQMQALNAATGAVHAAGWANAQGELQFVREDVGRHNALDKLIGALVSGAVDAPTGFIVVTSRASYEMVQKTAMAGIGLLAAVSAPTALAVRLARDAGLTLAGFTRGERCVVYADGAGRLTSTQDWRA
ncbi:MAG TPA: formate dehydrogenase accessory sulfurtransferase FdhD [Burkholderiales bacterium]|nr:formate dehydrogenase accessory sulfurtransferase FdhD [Burkholderiales bacterium]